MILSLGEAVVMKHPVALNLLNVLHIPRPCHYSQAQLQALGKVHRDEG